MPNEILRVRKQLKIESPVGPLYLIASEKGLQSLHWKQQNIPTPSSLEESKKEVKVLARAASELKEYFDGKRRKFSVRLNLEGTSFQKKVWLRLMKIPYGKTLSYKDVAKGIRNKKAMRAVGSANGKNPVCIIVPCHRVIAADGSIGGYAGGLPMKRKLLALEKN